jgi:hypothetical protein
MGSINRRIIVEAGLGKNTRPYPKNNYGKRVGGMTQVIKCLTSECEVLHSSLVPPKKEKVN